jgi:hypothetical protein
VPWHFRVCDQSKNKVVFRSSHWLALVITAVLAVMGVGRPGAAASSSSAQVTTTDAPSTQGALRSGSDRATHAPKSDARDGDAGALPSWGGIEIDAARSLAIASPASCPLVRPAQLLVAAALPRGPPSFV